MRTIVRQTGRRTTIEVKADKGEDLRGIAEALTTPTSCKKRVSVIEAAHYAAVQAWLKTIPDNGGELDSALDAAILAALPHLDGFSFQDGVAAWMQACFGPEITGDKLERGDRLLEEVFELLQSGDYPHDRINALQAYVYGRPKGEPFQEVGGVMVTLAAYCIAHNVDMHVCGGMELARVWTKIEQIRAKQAAKPKGSALPIAQTSPADKMSQAAIDVLAERRRQIEVEGWTPEHDDKHVNGELLDAAKAYFLNATGRLGKLYRPDSHSMAGTPMMWRWDAEWWKPKGPRPDCVRAAALCLAEADRCKRRFERGFSGATRFDSLEAEGLYALILAEIERLDRAASRGEG